MKVAINKESLKFAGAAIIVGAAALIMMPGIVGYIGSLWRLALWIGMALAGAWALSFLWARYVVSKQSKGN